MEGRQQIGHVAISFSSRTRNRLFATLVLLGAYILFYRYSNFFHTTDLRATPWNPETGIAVAAGIFMGWPAVPVVIVANFLGNVLWGSGLGLEWSLVSSILHGSVFAGSSAYLRVLLRKLQHPTTNQAIQFIVYALLVTLIAALFRMLVAQMALQVSPAYLWRYTAAVSIGNFIGILTVVPLALTLPNPESIRQFMRSLTPTDIVTYVLIGALSFVVFGLKGTDEFKFFYLLFFPITILAIRLGLPGAASAILVLDFAMVGILRWRGFEPSTGMELQLLMISLSATGLILGAAVSESSRMSQQLALSHERLQESQTALQQATRLSLASEMAAALAHELNQPLSAVRSFIRTARRKLDQPKFNRKQLADHIDEAVGEIDNAAALLRDARDFLSRGDVKKVPIDVASLVESSVELIKVELARARVELRIRLEPGLPKIYGNRSQLQQVLLNLIRNAKEAMTAENSALRRIVVSASHLTRPGYVEFAVSDSGPGIRDDLRPHLFTPLHSTKADGLGLGLSLCRSMITNHGGEIWHEDSARTGAKFIFTVPVSGRGMAGR